MSHLQCVFSTTLAALTAAVALGESPRVIPALDANFPKAVHYRYANNFKVVAGAEEKAYRKWLDDYGRTMGAELDGRVTDTTDGRREIIERVARERPDQFLIFYSTGHIKIPTDKTDPASGELSEYNHGHWVYLPRVRVLGDILRESGETTVRVDLPRHRIAAAVAANTVKGQDEDVAGASAPAAFSLRPDRGDDICLYSLRPDGQPDWENAEQVTLTAFDDRTGTIRVRRGCYGSKPRSFKGQVYAAVHAEVVKFQGWLYNFSTFCPKDRLGLTAGDIWAAAYARNFQPGGRAEHFHALQHDTLVERVFSTRGSDINNNGVEDAAEDFDGVNWFAVGLCETLLKLRGLLPEKTLVLPDAANRGFYQVNGWEVEGFPGRHDPAWRDYSSVCNVLEFSRHGCLTPRFTQVQHKIFNYTLGIDAPAKILNGSDLPFNYSRTVMALATVHEAAVTWYSQPPPESDGRPGVYDEMRAGREETLGWLGRAQNEPLYPGMLTPNLVPDALKRKDAMQGIDGTLVQSNGAGLKISRSDRTRPNRIQISLQSPGPELLVALHAHGSPRTGVTVRQPRQITATLSSDARPAGYLLPESGIVETGVISADGSVRPTSDVQTHQEFYQGFHALRLSADLTAASGGAAYWQVRQHVPANGRLSFWAFRGKGTLRVDAAAVNTDGSRGEFTTAVKALTPYGPAGFERNVSLAGLGLDGKTVDFRFIVQGQGRVEAIWAEPTIGSGDAGNNLPAGPIGAETTGWLGENGSTQVFQFPHVPTGALLRLTLEFEGGEDVIVERLAVHETSGAVARGFEHGVVLANPSPRPYTFDLARLFPGRKFKRIQGSTTQDTVTNNGQEVGSTVKLGRFDGLFLRALP